VRRSLGFLSLWLPVLAYMGAIYLLSSTSDLRWARQVPDTLLHGTEFFVLAVLVARALNGGLLTPMAPAGYLWTFVLSAHYALLDELHQALVPERVSSVLDLLADLAGIDLALAAVFVLQRILAARRARGPWTASG
jgi:VanZ family protein